MASDFWTDTENDLIVADYFAMLADDLAGRRYSKAAHNRALQIRIGRGRGSTEYKHQNISAVLQWLGQPWIAGYRTAVNFLGFAYRGRRALARPPPRLSSPMKLESLASSPDSLGTLVCGPPPTVSNRPPPKGLRQMQAVARKFDVAGRNERNRALGRAGEDFVLAHEKATLIAEGCTDLAKHISWVSQEEGDGAGYDISSFSPEGRTRLDIMD